MAAPTTLQSDWTPSGTVASPAAGGVLQQGWVDVAGGVWSINTGKVAAGAYGSSGWNKPLLRQTADNGVNQKVIIRFTYVSANNFYCVFRHDRAGSSNHYGLGLNASAKFAAYTCTNGTISNLSLSNTNTVATVGTAYDLVASVVQINSTTTTLTVELRLTDGTQLGNGTVVATGTVNNTLAGLQNVSAGVGFWTAASTDFSVQRVLTYNDAAYSVTTNASGFAVNSAATFTVTQQLDTSAATVITPSDNSGGGSFSPASITMPAGPASNGFSANFTYTPASGGTKTLSFANDQGLTNQGPIVINVVANATAYTVAGPTTAATGVGVLLTAAYVGSLSSAVTVTPSDGGAGGTFSPASVVLPAGVSLSVPFVYTPAATGSLTLSFTNSGSLSNAANLAYTVLKGIAVNDSNLFFSPGSWDMLTAGVQGVLTRCIQTANAGSYLKFVVSGTTALRLLIDPGPLATLEPTTPNIAWSVNEGPLTSTRVSSSTSSVTLATGLTAATTYTVQVWMVNSNLSAGSRYSTTVGVSATNVVRLLGLAGDSGVVTAAPTLRPNRAILLGDSINEGIAAGASGEYNALPTALPAVAGALNAEYCQVGFGSQGFIAPGSANAPFPTAYKNFSSGRPRNLLGFDYAICWHGTNDRTQSTSTLASAVSAWLTDARAQLGPNTWIFVVTPPGGFAKAGLDAGVTQYLGATLDFRVARIDVSDLVPVTGMTNSGASMWANDGLHPNYLAHSRQASAISQKITAVLNAAARPINFHL